MPLTPMASPCNTEEVRKAMPKIKMLNKMLPDALNIENQTKFTLKSQIQLV